MERKFDKETLALMREKYPNSTTTELLGELEMFYDKLESGQLVELPAPIGSPLWHIKSPERIDDDGNVWTVCTYKGATIEKCDYGLSLSTISHLGSIWFLSKEEAEQRLKALQRGE